MRVKIENIPSGGVTSPSGFRAGVACAGIKETAENKADIGILFSEAQCNAAALFTANQIKAAPVVFSRQRLQDGKAKAVVVNSGCANACTGEQGMKDAAEMSALAAEVVGVSSEDVLVASTGVIGQQLPMERVRKGIRQIVLSEEGGHGLAEAIMTTDTVAKEIAVRVNEARFIIGGTAKGAGMIHPNLATMLCFLTTDADVEVDFLRAALQRAVGLSFNMVSIDGDTSTNDMVLLMANRLAGGEPISEGSGQADAFQQALNHVCIYLARAIARDGEGATRLIEVAVDGAPGDAEAKLVARTIVGSSLVKAAVHGNDPNWGRIIAAAGRSGVEVVESKIDLYLGDICLLEAGSPVAVARETLVQELKSDEVRFVLNLNMGSASATAWGCDLSEEYVTINSQYTT